MIQWAWAYLTYQRGIRLITGSPEMHLERARSSDGPLVEWEVEEVGARAAGGGWRE